MLSFRRSRPALAAFACIALTCCAYKKTPPLGHYDLTKGYRFEQLPLSSPPAQRNSDELFVVLAFSGGGTRAAALSYGVLEQLRNVKFHWNPVTKAPELCASASSPACAATERTLLDEVDVISSVSGGSFTSAYYALNGDDIFNPQGKFHRSLLYYPVQRDLLGHAVYYPRNWFRLLSRVEIAAGDYARTIFGDTTFAALEKRSRPYLILNATDASAGARFEFTQEQFDLLCGDLSKIPIARGVAASSAFPGLLNSMTIDRSKKPCDYTGPGTSPTDWVGLALNDAFVNYPRYTAARRTEAYLDSTRQHIHLLDGGLADNIGLRSVIQSLTSTDRPTTRVPGSPPVLGGWSLLSKINNKQVKTVVIITVNARTSRKNNWDQKAAGPLTPSVINAASGIPMGNFSAETIESLKKTLPQLVADPALAPNFFAVEVAFQNLNDMDEQQFFGNLGTNFELARFEVDCLIDRGGRLLRESSFERFVREDLKGRIEEPSTPHPTKCTEDVARKVIKRSHYIDIGAQYHVTVPNSDDVDEKKNVGLAVRITKPNGFGATVGYGTESFDVPGTVGARRLPFGRLRLRTISGGVLYSRRAGRLEASVGVSAGLGFGNFTLEDDARDAYGRLGRYGVTTDATNTWVVKPNVSLWHNLTNRVAATVSASYVVARPTIHFGPDTFQPDRKIDASALRVSAGFGIKVF